MKIDTAKEKGLFRFTFNATEFFKDSEEELLVVMGEPTLMDFEKVSRKENPTADDYKKLLITYMVEHPFEEDGKKASNEKVVDLFNKMPALFLELVKEWLESCPLAQKKKEESEGSAP